uniref:Uncharacterized protein n=1 Tax=Rhizophora mucronata TaxID=61149 RepID=A0A2P2IPJ2_RHIMU
MYMAEKNFISCNANKGFPGTCEPPHSLIINQGRGQTILEGLDS